MNQRKYILELIIMTTEEFLLRRKNPDWRLSTIVDKNSFKYVNRIHPLKQRIVKEIVAAAKIDPYVKRIIFWQFYTI